ncbi:MAG: hypothetical protein JRF43_07095 [Deltaproteobacteria bacterium]|nr:hypothetical protein [Deltaproteobacteria bacterium]
MAEQFKISSQMTKKEIIEEYSGLLEAYKKKVKEAKESERWRSEAEKYKEAVALEAAKEATVHGVIENVTNLKGLLGKTLSDLTDRLSAQAERLEELKSAVALQEKRLKELYDIEEASDALNKLVDAYEERKTVAETEFASSITKLESDYEEKFAVLEKKYSELQVALQKEIEGKRVEWEDEKKRFLRELEEEESLTKQKWEREQAEYIYERDRTRKLEEDKYKENRTSLGKELHELKESTEKEFAERKAALVAQESELKDLREQAKKFPSMLQKEVEKEKSEAITAVTHEMEQKKQMAATEREWERKIYQQKIEFLEDTIASQEKEVTELKAETNSAMKQVHQIAEKAIAGASQAKAFTSVREIALEQAKKPEITGKAEG